VNDGAVRWTDISEGGVTLLSTVTPILDADKAAEVAAKGEESPPEDLSLKEAAILLGVGLLFGGLLSVRLPRDLPSPPPPRRAARPPSSVLRRPASFHRCTSGHPVAGGHQAHPVMTAIPVLCSAALGRGAFWRGRGEPPRATTPEETRVFAFCNTFQRHGRLKRRSDFRRCASPYL
jgi:hypothetical protein